MELNIVGRITADWPADDGTILNVLAPVMEGLPIGFASPMSLRPNRNANGELMKALIARAKAPSGLCAAVFAPDPFLRLESLVSSLLKTGISCVLNWPSVGIFDGPFARELERVSLGYGREVEFIRQVTSGGLDAVATTFSGADAQRMIDAGAKRVLLHPPLEEGRVMSAKRALAWAGPIAESIGNRGETLLYIEENEATVPNLETAAPISGVVLYAGSTPRHS